MVLSFRPHTYRSCSSSFPPNKSRVIKSKHHPIIFVYLLMLGVKRCFVVAFTCSYQTQKNFFLNSGNGASASSQSQQSDSVESEAGDCGTLIRVPAMKTLAGTGTIDSKSLSDEECMKRLPNEQFYITRQKGTQRTFTGYVIKIPLGIKDTMLPSHA
ncbi:unnamed protein product [Sphenostylis stenocarpa]|uniref:Uncharacterized protein n=1 Tax=Sphenostylis stenocarpa TaxID=92480 RepID=A0AA87BCQ8_9FABA|nr:unnamed protein product [Sphenostylis stenocarpa]